MHATCTFNIIYMYIVHTSLYTLYAQYIHYYTLYSTIFHMYVIISYILYAINTLSLSIYSNIYEREKRSSIAQKCPFNLNNKFPQKCTSFTKPKSNSNSLLCFLRVSDLFRVAITCLRISSLSCLANRMAIFSDQHTTTTITTKPTNLMKTGENHYKGAI